MPLENSKTEVVDEYRMEGGFGFPVVIRNAPKEHDDDSMEALGIPMDALQRAVLRELVATPRPWRGDEVAFVRAWFGESMAEFADHLGLTDAAVSNWESKGETPTDMTRGTEHLLRTRVASTLRERGDLDAREFADLVDAAMNFDGDAEPTPIEFDAESLALEDGPLDRDTEAAG